MLGESQSVHGVSWCEFQVARFSQVSFWGSKSSLSVARGSDPCPDPRGGGVEKTHATLNYFSKGPDEGAGNGSVLGFFILCPDLDQVLFHLSVCLFDMLPDPRTAPIPTLCQSFTQNLYGEMEFEVN